MTSDRDFADTSRASGSQTAPWASEDLRRLGDVRELAIAGPRPDGTRAAWTPIWVVVVGDGVFVRTWQRRTTGWYGRAVAAGRAWIELAGDAVEVVLEATGDDPGDAADAVDAAYRAKYAGAGAESMTTAESRASTLRLARTR